MSVLDSILRVAGGEYSPFRRKKFLPAKTYASDGRVYYEGRKAYLFDWDRKRWIRAREYDSKR